MQRENKCGRLSGTISKYSNYSHEHSWSSERKFQDEIASLSNEFALTPHHNSKALS